MFFKANNIHNFLQCRSCPAASFQLKVGENCANSRETANGNRRMNRRRCWLHLMHKFSAGHFPGHDKFWLFCIDCGFWLMLLM